MGSRGSFHRIEATEMTQLRQTGCTGEMMGRGNRNGILFIQLNLISPFWGFIPNKVGNNPNWCDTTNATATPSVIVMACHGSREEEEEEEGATTASRVVSTLANRTTVSVGITRNMAPTPYHAIQAWESGCTTNAPCTGNAILNSWSGGRHVWWPSGMYSTYADHGTTASMTSAGITRNMAPTTFRAIRARESGCTTNAPCTGNEILDSWSGGPRVWWPSCMYSTYGRTQRRA